MKFHLNYSPNKFDFEINHAHKLFLIGSCFSENMGEYLEQHRFRIYKNPNGILFNPASIYNNLNNLVHQNAFDEKFLLQRDGHYFSYLHHSKFHSQNKETIVEELNQKNRAAYEFLKQSEFLLITFGTAYVYEHLSLKSPVANCHKQAQSVFQKRALTVQEITTAYSGLIKELLQLRPELKIIFTVSPVKYLKDGLEANSRSKAVLLLAVFELVENFDNCYYFPAYELVNDDLRDYRFYKEDLAHPNEQAISYIWDKFSVSCFNHETLALNQLIQKLNIALKHRQMLGAEEEATKHRDYIQKLQTEIGRINPALSLSQTVKKS